MFVEHIICFSIYLYMLELHIFMCYSNYSVLRRVTGVSISESMMTGVSRVGSQYVRLHCFCFVWTTSPEMINYLPLLS